MENASRAFLEAVRKSMRQIRQVIGSTTINPHLLTCAERLQYEGYLRREETNTTVGALATEGVPIKQIVRRTGLSRGTVRQILRGCRSDVFRQRESSLEAYWPLLDAPWNGGCRNGAELWRRVRANGFAVLCALWENGRPAAVGLNGLATSSFSACRQPGPLLG